MSLRDFHTPYSDDPTALHHMPKGNETGLESFHTVQPEDIEPNNMPKIVGAVAVALMVSAAGVALYASQGSSSSQPKQMIAAAPAATVPVNPVPAAAPLPDAGIPASTPEPAAPKPAPVKSASATKSSSSSSTTSSSAPASDAMSARMAAANDANPVSTQSQQQAAIAPTLEQPATPSPSPSDVASNNMQSSVAVPQGATTAADIPNPAPAQNANPIPAPTEPSGQIAQ